MDTNTLSDDKRHGGGAIQSMTLKLDMMLSDVAAIKTDLKIIETKLDMIDGRGCSKSNEQLEMLDGKINALGAKVSAMAGAAAVVSIIFSTVLAKLGMK